MVKKIDDSWIRLAPATIEESTRSRVEDVLARGAVGSYGRELDHLEDRMSELMGVKHAVGLSSGTAALQLALLCLGLRAGDQVWASSFTFVGSIAGAFREGLDLVFFDSDRETWNIDCGLIEDTLAERQEKGEKLPKALLVTDAYGQPCDLDRLRELCSRFGVFLVVDAAESLGSKYKGKPVGAGADACVVSLNGNKIVTSGGGGVLLCDDERLSSRARYLASQAKENLPYYEHQEIGFNFRMGNLAAAVGLGELEYLDDRVLRKRAIFSRYRDNLKDLAQVSFMPEAKSCRSNRWLTVLKLQSVVGGVSRDKIQSVLEANCVEARPVWKPMHLQPAFRVAAMVGGQVCEEIWNTGLCLPSGSSLNDSQIDYICGLIRDVVTSA